jgi:putative transposase
VQLPHVPGVVREQRVKVTILQRRSIRLPDFDYSLPGKYFITLITHNREPLFGEIEGGKMDLNEAGRLVEETWACLPRRYPQVETDSAAVMPDHFHGILRIKDDEQTPVIHEPVRAIHELPLREIELAEQRRKQRRMMTLPLVVGYFKMNTAKRINILRGTAGKSVWRRNYFERVIRDEKEFQRIQQYIETNVENWEEDDFHGRGNS